MKYESQISSSEKQLTIVIHQTVFPEKKGPLVLFRFVILIECGLEFHQCMLEAMKFCADGNVAAKILTLRWRSLNVFITF